MISREQKEIVIVNQDAGYLMIDIANAFHKKDYKVHLITGRLAERNSKLHSSIRVSKIVKYRRSSTFKRLVTWSIAFFQSWFLILIKYRKATLLLVSNPPFSTLIPNFVKNDYSLLIYDVYPDALVHYKVFKDDSFLIKWWKKLNKKIYRKATGIYTISDGMKSLMSQYTMKEAIEVVPIWTDNDFLKPLEKKENPFVRDMELDGKFTIMYSGNLGRTHRVEIFLDLAAALTAIDFTFLIIGGGEQYSFLENEIKRRQLSNIKLMTWVSVDVLPYSLAAADIGIVSLGSEASQLSIPSKTYNLMSVGVPILGISNENSELAKLIETNHIGRNFDGSTLEPIVNFVLELYRDDSKRLFYRKHAIATSKKFSVENAFKFIP